MATESTVISSLMDVDIMLLANNQLMSVVITKVKINPHQRTSGSTPSFVCLFWFVVFENDSQFMMNEGLMLVSVAAQLQTLDTTKSVSAQTTCN